jgi:uncharacterized RDD family membrane protein YckC/type II secretory pathway pseudopilin PulG
MEEKKPIVGPPGGFFPRAGALLLDALILILLLFILNIVVAILVPLLVHGSGKDSEGVTLVIVFSFLYLGIPCLYFTLFTAMGGQTLGKKAFNLKVAIADGRPVGFIRAFLRWFCSVFSGLFLALGYILAAIQKDKRALHDLISGTKVVQVAPYNQSLLIVFLCVVPFCGVAFVGILAAIAIPRFAQMLEKSREGVTKGNLGALKSAVGSYYTDHQRQFPADLEKGLVPKYLNSIPPVKATGVFVRDAKSPAGNSVTPAKKGEVPTGSGSGWLYDSTLGNVYVNSTVHDSHGIPYSFYGSE